MDKAIVNLIAGSIVFWWLFVLLVMLTVGVLWPLMALSAMRNIKGIRRELQQLNETLSSKMTITKSGGPLGL